MSSSDLRASSLDLHPGSIDLRLSSSDLRASSLDLHPGSFDLRVISSDLLASSLDLHTGSFDLRVNSPNLRTGSLELRSGRFSGQRMSERGRGAAPARPHRRARRRLTQAVWVGPFVIQRTAPPIPTARAARRPRATIRNLRLFRRSNARTPTQCKDFP
ncbi:MAG TPA: hypothetical protein VJ484_08090 [Lysobacter sp.]|nr:hypothetical protein [Lysobacter sp.]